MRKLVIGKRRFRASAIVVALALVAAGSLLEVSGFAGTAKDDALTVGLLHLYYGEDQAAVRQLAAAQKIYPDDPEILAGLALAWQEGGNGVEAATTWKKVAGAGNANAPAASLRGALLAMAGDALRKTGRLDEADRLFVDALKDDAKLALALAGRGRIESAREHWGDALPFYQQALTVNEDYSEARYELGRALRHLGRNGDAASELKKALLADSTFAPAYLELGLAYRGLGRDSDAEFALKRALSLDPSLSDARSALDRLRSDK